MPTKPFHPLLTFILLISQPPLFAQITLTKNYTGGQAIASVSLGDDDADHTQTVFSNTLLGYQIQALSDTGNITRTHSNGDTSTASASAQITAESTVDLTTKTISYTTTHTNLTTKTGSVIGSISQTKNLQGHTKNHRLQFTLTAATPITFQATLTGTIGTTALISLKRLTPTTASYYLAYSSIPNPALLSETLTPGTYEIIISGLNDSIGGNQTTTRTATYTLSLPDTTPLATLQKSPTLTALTTNATKTTLTLDHGTANHLTIQRTTNLIDWTTLTTTQATPTFIDPETFPATFYRLLIP